MFAKSLKVAVIAYVFLLMLVQGVFYTAAGLVDYLDPGPGGFQWGPDNIFSLLTLIFGVLAVLTGFFLLLRGWRWAAVAAIAIEVVWLGLAGSSIAADALFLAAIVGLLLKPVRSYRGPVRRAR